MHHGEGLESIQIKYPEYTDIVLSPRLDLLEITRNRLQETHRIDMAGTKHPINEGMFGIKFPDLNNLEPSPPIPLNHLLMHSSFTEQNYDALRHG